MDLDGGPLWVAMARVAIVKGEVVGEQVLQVIVGVRCGREVGRWQSDF